MRVYKREEMYVEGGCLSVTSRILIVDLLSGIVPVELIHGIIVLDAHRITRDSCEAFILRVFRHNNKVF